MRDGGRIPITISPYLWLELFYYSSVLNNISKPPSYFKNPERRTLKTKIKKSFSKNKNKKEKEKFFLKTKVKRPENGRRKTLVKNKTQGQAVKKINMYTKYMLWVNSMPLHPG